MNTYVSQPSRDAYATCLHYEQVGNTIGDTTALVYIVCDGRSLNAIPTQSPIPACYPVTDRTPHDGAQALRATASYADCVLPILHVLCE